MDAGTVLLRRLGWREYAAEKAESLRVPVRSWIHVFPALLSFAARTSIIDMVIADKIADRPVRILESQKRLYERTAVELDAGESGRIEKAVADRPGARDK